MQSTAVNLEFKLKVIFKILSCNRPRVICNVYLMIVHLYTEAHGLSLTTGGQLMVLLDFSLTVKAATLIFIYVSGSAIPSAKQGKSGSIYDLMKNK